MGLFASRPEEEIEWAGLPSEPLAPESEAERLEAAPATSGGLGIPGVTAGGETVAITLPSAPAAPDTDPAA